MGRWHSVDPLAEKYHPISPYAYVANNPIIYIDPNGMEIVNPSEKELQAIVEDLNRIFQDQYGVENAFSVQKRVRTKKVRSNDWSIFDPSSWGNAFEEAEYEEVEVVDFKISKNEEFDWGTDEYSQGMADLVDAESDVTLDIVGDNSRQYKRDTPMNKDGLLEDYGGGYTVNSRKVILSNKLSKSEGSNKRSKWTLGGLVLHELLYHIHPMGKSEGSANKMRKHFGLRTGKNHPAGSRQIRSLKKKKN